MIESKWIFITGVYGSGKSTLAKQVSEQYGYPLVGFDDLMDYSLKTCNCRKILDRLEDMDNFIMDAIPISLNFGLEGGEQATWEMFTDWEKKQNVQVICSYCPEEVWIGRIALRSKVTIHPISQTFVCVSARQVSCRKHNLCLAARKLLVRNIF